MPCDHEHPHDGIAADRGRRPAGRGHDHGHAHHGHSHAHGFSLERLDRAMAVGVGLNTLFVAVEITAGIVGGSLALLADAGHNAGDVVGLLLAWGASHLARRPPTPRYTWGFRRSTIYAALANAVLLLLACGGIAREAMHRLQEPVAVAGPTMIAVAAVGVVINTLTALLFLRGSGEDANVRGAFLHMAADAAVSLGVVVAGIAVSLTGLAWIDPLVGLAIVATILVGTWGLLRESVDLALDAVPRGIDPAEVTACLAALPGVADVHDLHVWNASTSEVSLTVHLVVADGVAHDAVLAAAAEATRGRFAIAHTTIQLEGREAGAACPQRPADAL